MRLSDCYSDALYSGVWLSHLVLISSCLARAATSFFFALDPSGLGFALTCSVSGSAFLFGRCALISLLCIEKNDDGKKKEMTKLSFNFKFCTILMVH